MRDRAEKHPLALDGATGGVVHNRLASLLCRPSQVTVTLIEG